MGRCYPFRREYLNSIDDLEYIIINVGDTPVPPGENYPNYLYGKSGDPTITLICNDENRVIVDPGYSGPLNAYIKKEKELKELLREKGFSVSEISHLFITHNHFDHDSLAYIFFLKGVELVTSCGDFENLLVLHTPGHTPNHKSLLFKNRNKIVCVAGDAIINEDYFTKNEYYRPNGYTKKEVEQTKKTMRFLSEISDIIIPGHGKQFETKKED